MSRTKIAGFILGIFLMVAGCVSGPLAWHIMPGSRRNEKAVEYVLKSGVCDPNALEGYWNVAKQQLLNEYLDMATREIQFQLDLKKARDREDYTKFKKIVADAFEQDKARAAAWFGPKGIVSVALGLAGIGVSGLTGLMISKPGEISKTIMEQAVADIQGKSTAELTAKDKHITQVVMGIQDIFNGLKNKKPLPEVEKAIAATIGVATTELSEREKQLVEAVKEAFLIEMKSSLAGKQDSDTKLAVSTIKKNMLV